MQRQRTGDLYLDVVCGGRERHSVLTRAVLFEYVSVGFRVLGASWTNAL